MTKLKAKIYSLLFFFVLGSAFIVYIAHSGPSNPNGYNDRNQRVLFVAEFTSNLPRINVNITWAVGPHIEGPVKLTNINPKKQKDWKQSFIPYDGFSQISMAITSNFASSLNCKIFVNDYLKDNETGTNQVRCFWPHI